MKWIFKFSIYISNIFIARDSHTSANVKIVILDNPENYCSIIHRVDIMP